MSEHLSNYAARDHEVVDYQMVELPGTDLWFRGPLPDLKPGEYVTCVGAAQTFGCFCERPYPTLLAESLGLPVLNLGYGGAGPRFFARQERLLEIVNRGQLTIVQVMSGRSEDNSRFESGGLERLTRRRDGKPMAADDAWRSVLEWDFRWKRSPVGRGLLRRLSQRFARPEAERLVAETLRNYVNSSLDLLNAISTPKVLLWFSRRQPSYTPSLENLHRFFGAFPQLVDQPTVEAIRPHADAYIECVTERGMPQPLVSRFTGDPVEVKLAADRDDFAGRVWTHNTYYPSPEMQVDAAAMLEPVIAQLLK